MPGFVPKVPLRIPARYRMYNVHRPNFADERIMAPNRAMARYYYKKEFGPGQVQLDEAYGPFYPSEEAQMRKPSYDKAYEREVAKRRQELVDEYKWRMENEEVEPFSDEELNDYYDRQARHELDDWLDNYQEYRLPVKRMRPFLNIGTRPPKVIEAFGLEGAADRLRFRGHPESEIGPIIDRELGKRYR